ncbi:hypothetical protein Rruber_02699 [Rhodococcus ruber]|uniref:hypothetical protein n=1 Tax=Rhodococcus ruber TaxID=1830 RepID=UPI00315D957A
MSAAFNLPSDPGRIEQLETTIAAEVHRIDDLQRENERLEFRNADLAEQLVAAETQRDKTRDLLEVKERQALAHADENDTLKRGFDDALKQNRRLQADLTRCRRLLGQGLDLLDTWANETAWEDERAQGMRHALTRLPEDGAQ